MVLIHAIWGERMAIKKTGIIGILAGMGPRSTAPFINLVYDECQKQYDAKDDFDFPKIIVYSLPTPFYANRPIDHAAMESALHAGIRDLEKIDVNFIAIACNTAHVYYPQLAKNTMTPLLNMVEITLREKSDSKQKIAVVAARPTFESEIYQKEIKRSGSEFIPVNWQSQIDDLIESVKTSKDAAFFRMQWQALLAQAEAAGAETVIIACLDLSAISEHIKCRLKIVDASRCLAHFIVKKWLKQETAAASWKKENFILDTDKEKLQYDRIHKFLTRTYWCEGIPLEVVTKAAQNSLCFGLYDTSQNNRPQIGFARVVTDSTTFAWLCDVYIEETYRGQGLSKWVMECVTSHPALKGLRRICLATKDAHTLYTKYGFEVTQTPANWMEIKDNDLYKKMKVTC